jgi:hypothetical protein
MAVKKGYLDSIPTGWIKVKGATTAPEGYSWYSNGKSRFSGEYECALVKDGESVDGCRAIGTDVF